MTREVSERKPIINCHTHIFTGDHVPPYLAKTFLIWPLYYLLHLSVIVNFFRWWYKYPARIKYKWWYKRLVKWRNLVTTFLDRFGFIKTLTGLYITVQVIFILFDWVADVFPPEQSRILKWFSDAGIWLKEHNLLLTIGSSFFKILLIVFVFLFVAWAGT